MIVKSMMAGQYICPIMSGRVERVPGGPDFAWCEGSACMAWRYHKYAKFQQAPNLEARTESEAGGAGPAGWTFEPGSLEAGDSFAGWREPDEEREGYCGMAGPLGRGQTRDTGES